MPISMRSSHKRSRNLPTSHPRTPRAGPHSRATGSLQLRPCVVAGLRPPTRARRCPFQPKLQLLEPATTPSLHISFRNRHRRHCHQAPTVVLHQRRRPQRLLSPVATMRIHPWRCPLDVVLPSLGRRSPPSCKHLRCRCSSSSPASGVVASSCHRSAGLISPQARARGCPRRPASPTLRPLEIRRSDHPGATLDSASAPVMSLVAAPPCLQSCPSAPPPVCSVRAPHLPPRVASADGFEQHDEAAVCPQAIHGHLEKDLILVPPDHRCCAPVRLLNFASLREPAGAHSSPRATTPSLHISFRNLYRRRCHESPTVVLHRRRRPQRLPSPVATMRIHPWRCSLDVVLPSPGRRSPPSCKHLRCRCSSSSPASGAAVSSCRRSAGLISPQARAQGRPRHPASPTLCPLEIRRSDHAGAALDSASAPVMSPVAAPPHLRSRPSASSPMCSVCAPDLPPHVASVDGFEQHDASPPRCSLKKTPAHLVILHRISHHGVAPTLLHLVLDASPTTSSPPLTSRQPPPLTSPSLTPLPHPRVNC